MTTIDHASLQSLSAFQEKSKESSARRKSQQQSACAAARVFARYDVIETSYHFYSDRIDLHLCDDPGGSESITECAYVCNRLYWAWQD